jgi:hypothetical protein
VREKDAKLAELEKRLSILEQTLNRLTQTDGMTTFWFLYLWAKERLEFYQNVTVCPTCRQKDDFCTGCGYHF